MGNAHSGSDDEGSRAVNNNSANASWQLRFGQRSAR